MHFRQAVSPEDMFLGTGNKTPATASCEQMVPIEQSIPYRSAIDFASKDSQRLALEQWNRQLRPPKEDSPASTPSWSSTASSNAATASPLAKKTCHCVKKLVCEVCLQRNRLHTESGSWWRNNSGSISSVVDKKISVTACPTAVSQMPSVRKSASKLPGTKSANELNLDIREKFLDLRSARYRLGLHLPKCGGPRFG
uniref:Uncharacterized protein n=1 Tax=Macrostomum lignano TaxID=282301 RepID=A0A1I8FJP1_9PLAT